GVYSTVDIINFQQLIIARRNWHGRSLGWTQAPCPVSAGPGKGRHNESINAHENRRHAGHRCSVSAWRHRRSADEDHDRARRDPEGQGPEKALFLARLVGVLKQTADLRVKRLDAVFRESQAGCSPPAE